MSDWRPEHEGEGRYRRKLVAALADWLAIAFMGMLITASVMVAAALVYLFPWGLG